MLNTYASRLIYNCIGTQGVRPHGKSHRDDYRSFRRLYCSGIDYTEVCSVQGCPETEVFGAHVGFADEVGAFRSRYIALLCHYHNMQRNVMRVKHDTFFAPVGLDGRVILPVNAYNGTQSSMKMHQGAFG